MFDDVVSLTSLRGLITKGPCQYNTTVVVFSNCFVPVMDISMCDVKSDCNFTFFVMRIWIVCSTKLWAQLVILLLSNTMWWIYDLFIYLLIYNDIMLFLFIYTFIPLFVYLILQLYSIWVDILIIYCRFGAIYRSHIHIRGMYCCRLY